jgi:hypothetical protein
MWQRDAMSDTRCAERLAILHRIKRLFGRQTVSLRNDIGEVLKQALFRRQSSHDPDSARNNDVRKLHI